MTYTLTFRDANETSPLYLFIRDGKNREKIPLGIREDPNTYDRDEQRFLKTNHNYRSLNAKLAFIEEMCDGIVDEFHEKGGGFDKFRKRVIEEIEPIVGACVRREDEGKFLPFFRRWALTDNTIRTFNRQRKSSYKLFVEFCGKADPMFDDVTYALSEDYIEWMAKRGLAANTRGTHVRNLKAAMNEAYKRELHENTQFRRFRKESEDPEDVYLSTEEVDRIASLKLEGMMDKARDLFLIGCHTGLRISDYSRITTDDIHDGVLHLMNVKTRKKSITVDIPVHPRVMGVLKKYGGRAPKLAEQHVNALIKVVCSMAGINERMTLLHKGHLQTDYKYNFVTSHTARRSGLTNLYKAGVSTYRCMLISGHTSEKTFFKYIKITAKENAEDLKDCSFFKE
jgi:integrase